jgi:hypothetical protein
VKPRAEALLARAQAVLAVPGEVCGETFKDWTWEPEALLAARRALGAGVEEFTKVVTPAEYQAAADARRKAEVERQRAMLKARAEAARR